MSRARRRGRKPWAWRQERIAKRPNEFHALLALRLMDKEMQRQVLIGLHNIVAGATEVTISRPPPEPPPQQEPRLRLVVT
jgi:hypothetical protein